MGQFKRRHKDTAAGILFGVWILALLAVMPVRAADAPEDDIIYYTALGDSIPKGYSSSSEVEIKSYPGLITEDLEAISQRQVMLSNYAKNGLTAAKLNTVVLAEPEVKESLKRADFITVTAGANDLMNEFKKVAQEILGHNERFYNVDSALTALQDGIEENPLLLVKVIAAIGSWDYDSFEEQWMQAMETIQSWKPNDTQIIVTTIYNPVSKMELPGTLNAVVERVIGKMNDIITNHAKTYGYAVADLLNSGINEYTQSDGLHPSQAGQHLMKELIEEQMDMEAVTGPLVDEEAKEAEEEKARAKAEAKELARQKERTGKGLILLCVNIGFLWLVIFLYRDRRR